MPSYKRMHPKDWHTSIVRLLRIHEATKLLYKPWRKRKERRDNAKIDPHC